MATRTPQRHRLRPQTRPPPRPRPPPPTCRGPRPRRHDQAPFPSAARRLGSQPVGVLCHFQAELCCERPGIRCHVHVSLSPPCCVTLDLSLPTPAQSPRGSLSVRSSERLRQSAERPHTTFAHQDSAAQQPHGSTRVGTQRATREFVIVREYRSQLCGSMHTLIAKAQVNSLRLEPLCALAGCRSCHYYGGECLQSAGASTSRRSISRSRSSSISLSRSCCVTSPPAKFSAKPFWSPPGT